MFQLIKIEWLKIKRYPAFWGMIAIVTLSYPGLNYIIGRAYNQNVVNNTKNQVAQLAKFLLGNPFAFPETWHTIAYFSSFFVMIPAILVIMLATNEYNYKTHRQNIIDGWSRNEFITGKLMDVIIVSLLSTLLYALVALALGIYFDDGHLNRWAEQLQYIPYFFIQTFSQLSIAFLTGYLIKKAFIALGVYFFYSLILENILVGYLSWNKIEAAKFLPFEMSDRIIPKPAFISKFGKDLKDAYEKALDAIPEQIIYTVIFTALIWFLCYKLHNRKDL
ncbi:MAG: ABC transporter permease subunit [Sphingobacteriia bacterium]|nr:ABC transporter permease subunit [Sphingobacteriia bacterium]